MKHVCLFILLTATLLFNMVYASHPGGARVPFENVPLTTDDYSGLDFDYSLDIQPLIELTCSMTGADSAILLYRPAIGNGEYKKIMVGSKFILTPAGKANHIWATSAGSVILFDIQQNKKSKILVSCHYQTSHDSQ